MRIAHVVYECEPGYFVGGVQKMVYELALAQTAQGDEVEIITIGNHVERRIDERLRIRYFLGTARWDSHLVRDVLFKEHDRFDVVHSHNTFLPLNRVTAAFSRRFSKAVFFNVHGALDPVLLSGWHPKAWKKRIYNALVERPNLNTAQGVIGLTREECRQLRRFGVKVPIYEVPNGITVKPAASAQEARAFRDRLGIPAGDPLVLFIGRITAKKGIHHLIEAIAEVKIAVPNVRLVICGPREQEPHYTALLDKIVTTLGLADHVRWAGFLDEEGKRAALGAADLFAHPSLSEGMALAILEAMSCGVPTVVTPGCYMEQAVKAGVLIESSQNASAIAAAILRILNDKPARIAMGRRAREYIEANHNWAYLAKRMAGVYRGEPAADLVYRD